MAYCEQERSPRLVGPDFIEMQVVCKCKSGALEISKNPNEFERVDSMSRRTRVCNYQVPERD